MTTRAGLIPILASVASHPVRAGQPDAEVLSTTGSATVPAMSCAATCVVTREFTPIEPDADEQKYHAPGIGLIPEVEMPTGARNEPVSFTGG